MKRLKRSWVYLGICLAVILVSSIFASAIQSNWGRVRVTDLRYATNSGPWAKNPSIKVKGSVVSGLLFVPKDASSNHKLPAIVVTHGYLNNREFMIPDAIELSRRGFIVLAVDREGHGNYNSTNNAVSTKGALFSRGVYDGAKYLYNLNYVNQSEIGITGHSMGGFDTAATLMEDATNVTQLANSSLLGIFAGDKGRTDLTPQNGYGLGIISAGLMQGWDNFAGANPNVSVGFAKANDDEFFFGANSFSNPGDTLANGTPSLSRQYLNSVYAAKFVGVSAKGPINVKNGGIYINGSLTNVPGGKAASAPFRVIYQHNEIHPLNTYSLGTVGSVANFFNTAFGTPPGAGYIPSWHEIWWLKAVFSTIGLIAFFAMLFPLSELLLSVPFFSGLSKRQVQALDGVGSTGTETSSATVGGFPVLRGTQKHLSYWLTGIVVTLFAGFSLRPFATGLGLYWFPLTQRYPQDTTNWIVMWAIATGLFALGVTLAVWGINAIINRVRYGRDKLLYNNSNPLAAAEIDGGLGALTKTLLLAGIIVGSLYVVLYIIWWIFHVDFRTWTFDVKVFDVPMMLPTMLRYAVLFGIYFSINSILNQTYRMRNLPEWLTIAINAFFNIGGILLVIVIQYATFKSTGKLWEPSMNLGYIVAFPLLPILVIATIISRVLYRKTGNAWLGGFVNTLLFTIITCANTATSFHYIFG